MKIAILSDSHDNMPNIDKFLNFARQNEVEAMIHCGDICRPDVLQHFADNFAGDIYAVHGNIDYDYFVGKGLDSRLRGNDRGESGNSRGENKKAPQPCGTMEPTENDRLKFFGEIGKIEIAGEKIAFCHLPEQARELAEFGKYDYVFYGHTHLPAQKMVGKCMMLNPGTLAGTFSRATFALWDTEKNVFELKLLEKL